MKHSCLKYSVLSALSLALLSGCSSMPYSGLVGDTFEPMTPPPIWTQAPPAKKDTAQDAQTPAATPATPAATPAATPDPTQAAEPAAPPEPEYVQQTGWWKNFDSPVLNTLVEHAMSESPDRKIAAARIEEARGMKRSSFAALFPEINASAEEGRSDNGLYPISDTDQYALDVSYEIDLFGKNRKTLNAAQENLRSLIAQYHDTTLSLIAEISRSYAQLQAYNKQVLIAKENLKLQQETLDLIQTQQQLGEAPQLDVERAENIVNTTMAAIPDYERLANAARLSLGVLVGVMPAELNTLMAEPEQTQKQKRLIPAADLDKPIMDLPAAVLTQRPDIQAAWADLSRHSALADATAAQYFPSLTISGMFGTIQTAVINRATIWDIALGAAVSVLDFGRLEGQVDAARAREKQAYETYRKTVLSAVAEVETALSDYAQINRRYAALTKAHTNAAKSLDLSKILYTEGEVSFLDVLDAQRTRNESDSALVTAELAKAEALIRLYKALGVY